MIPPHVQWKLCRDYSCKTIIGTLDPTWPWNKFVIFWTFDYPPPTTNTTKAFYRQKHVCSMGSLVSRIVANLYMEEMESRALTSFKGTTPSHLFRSVDDTWVKIETQEVLMEQNKICAQQHQAHKGGHSGQQAAQSAEGSPLKSTGKLPTQTSTCSSHQPLEHKLGVIRTLHHQTEIFYHKDRGEV